MKTPLLPFYPVAVSAHVISFSALANTEAVNGINWAYSVSGGKAPVGGGANSSPTVPLLLQGVIAVPSKADGKVAEPNLVI